MILAFLLCFVCGLHSLKLQYAIYCSLDPKTNQPMCGASTTISRLSLSVLLLSFPDGTYALRQTYPIAGPEVQNGDIVCNPV